MQKPDPWLRGSGKAPILKIDGFLLKGNSKKTTSEQNAWKLLFLLVSRNRGNTHELIPKALQNSYSTTIHDQISPSQQTG